MLQQGALLSSDEFRVERRANGEASSVMARLSSLARRWSVVGAAELPTSAWGWAIRIWDGSNLAPRLISRARFLPSPIPTESPSARSSRPVGLAPAAPGAAWTPARAAGPGSRAATGGPAGTPRALDAARERRGIGPGGRDNGRSAAGGRGPAAAPAPPARPFHDPQQRSRHGYRHLQVALRRRRPCQNALWPRPRTQQAVPAPGSRTRETWPGMGRWPHG
jgi:hypothetical protein